LQILFHRFHAQSGSHVHTEALRHRRIKSAHL